MNRALRHLRANAIAYLALFVALGAGGAWAVDKITSKDIAKNAVRSKHIKAGQVKPKDADLTKSRFGSTLQTTSDGVELPELNLTIAVRQGDAVSIQGFALAKGGSDGCGFTLDAEGPGIPASGLDRVLRFNSGAFERRYIDGTTVGTTDFLSARPIEYLVPADGQLRLRPVLFAQGPAAGCEIRTRGLAVTVER